MKSAIKSLTVAVALCVSVALVSALPVFADERNLADKNSRASETSVSKQNSVTDETSVTNEKSVNDEKSVSNEKFMFPTSLEEADRRIDEATRLDDATIEAILLEEGATTQSLASAIAQGESLRELYDQKLQGERLLAACYEEAAQLDDATIEAILLEKHGYTKEDVATSGQTARELYAAMLSIERIWEYYRENPGTNEEFLAGEELLPKPTTEEEIRANTLEAIGTASKAAATAV